MRRTLLLLLAALAVGAGIYAEQKTFSLRIAAADGKAAANLPVYDSTSSGATAIGRTTAQGDLDIALAADKNGKSYNVYRMNCSRLVIVEAGSAEDNSCKSQSDPNLPPDQCGRCVPLGGFIWGQSSTVGTFSGSGSAWKNPWVITSIVGAGVLVPAVTLQGGSASAPPTQTAVIPPAAPPPTTPAPPPTSFTVTNARISGTATQDGQRTCNLIAPTYPVTGTYVLDASGRITLNLTDPTNITQVYSGTGTFTSATSFSFSSLGPFNFSGSTGRNYQGQPGAGTTTPTSGSFKLSIFYQGGGTPGPTAGCSDPFVITFNVQ